MTTNRRTNLSTEQRQTAYDLRAAGATYADIGALFGMTERTAYNVVRRFAARNDLPMPNYSEAHARRTSLGMAAAARRVATEGRRFGVEIECTHADHYSSESAGVAAARAISEAGIACSYRGYTHAGIDGWKVVYDGSLSDGSCEVVSPPMTGFDELRTVLTALRSAGFRVDRECGLHVHHEVTDLTGSEIGALVRLYAGQQAALDALVAPSRRSTRRARWCQPLHSTEVDRFARAFDTVGDDEFAVKQRRAMAAGIGGRPDSRYRVLNVHSFANYGTVEFRQHQGTLNARKVEAWVRLGQAMIEAARHADDIAVGSFLADLTGAGRLDVTTAEYLASRQATLA